MMISIQIWLLLIVLRPLVFFLFSQQIFLQIPESR